MKENIKLRTIKKESLKKLSKKNLLDIILIMFLSISVLFLKTSLFFLLIYSLFKISFTQNLFFYLDGFKESSQTALIISSSILMGLSIILYFPLKLGIKRWFYSLSENSKRPLYDIFYYYSSIKLFVRSILLKITCTTSLLIKIGLPLIISFSLFVISCINIKVSRESLTLFEVLFIVSSILIFGSIMFSFKTFLVYILTPYIFVSNDSEKLYKTIKSSNFLFKTNKSLFYKFYLLSVPSFILSILFFPCFFTTPYLYLSMSKLTKKVVYKQNQGIETIPLTEKVIDISKELLI